MICLGFNCITVILKNAATRKSFYYFHFIFNFLLMFWQTLLSVKFVALFL